MSVEKTVFEHEVRNENRTPFSNDVCVQLIPLLGGPRQSLNNIFYDFLNDVRLITRDRKSVV